MIKRKTKTLILGSAGVIVAGAVTTAIAVPASKAKSFEVQYFESGAALPSLNHVIRADTALSPVYGFFMEGIISAANPQVLSNLASDYSNRGYKNYVPYTIAGKEQNETKKPLVDAKYRQFRNTAYNKASSFDPITGDSLLSANGDKFDQLKSAAGELYAPGVTDIIEVNEKEQENTSFRARVNPDAGWSNGDKILASDFVATIKNMLDITTASYGAQVLYETLHMRGAKEIIKKQKVGKMTINQAWQWAIDNDLVPVTVEGTDNRWVHYFLRDDTAFTTVIPYLGGAQFMPVNEKFVNSIGGIMKYGQTKDTILSDGPYKISSMDLDYMVTFSKNEYYYEPEMVLIDHPGYKVSPSSAIQLKLFEDGKLSNMDVAPELLASIYKTPSLIPLLGHGGVAPATSGVKFSKYYADMHNDPTKSDYSPTNDKDFRKAVMYSLDRNKYASFINQSGSSPAASVFAPRDKTAISDENGDNYYKSLLSAKYKEYDPANPSGTASSENLGFDGYDPTTKYNAAYSSQLNHEYIDYLYNKKLANDYLDAFLKRAHKSSVSLKVDIVSSEENSFLSLQSLMKETFGNKLNVSSHLISSQIMSDEAQNGEYQSMFGSISTSVDDPWTLYSQVLIEDGYEDSENHIPYITSDTNGKIERSMLVTTRDWTIPGFSIQNAINDIEDEVDGETKTAALERMDMTEAQWDLFKKAVKEAQVSHVPTEINQAPVFKYGVATQVTKLLSEKIETFTDEDAAVGTDAYESSVNLLTPYVRKDGSQGKDKIFHKPTELFGFYNDIEKLLRDSSWFVPTLTSTSGWFIERRGLRAYGNQEGMPFGYRNIYPKDNIQLIDALEARILEKYGVKIVLERA